MSSMFLRGLGIGIIITSLIYFFFYNISDEDVIKRANKLGMVYKSELSNDLEIKDDKEEIKLTENKDKLLEDEKLNNLDDKDKIDTENLQLNDNKENVELNNNSDKKVVSQSEQKDNKKKIDKVKITIKPGTTLNPIVNQLLDKGLITDYDDYINYLYANNRANKFQVGIFEIEKGASYEEITKILTKWHR